MRYAWTSGEQGTCIDWRTSAATWMGLAALHAARFQPVTHANGICCMVSAPIRSKQTLAVARGGHGVSSHPLGPSYSCLFCLVDRVNKIEGVQAAAAEALQSRDPFACYAYGQLFFRGGTSSQDGKATIVRDEQRALPLLRIAADQGHASAQYYLGVHIKNKNVAER